MEDSPSSSTQGFRFDADLTDLLLTTLSDISSLESFVLSSRFIYNVFQTRRTSILRTIISNHLGLVTPQAMRLLKVMTDINSYWHGWLAPLPANRLPSEDDCRLDAISAPTITLRDVHKLAANHDAVRELEALYSWRTKDPRSPSTRLTPAESSRFQTALYRIWFICTMYGRPAPANRVRKSKYKRQTEILRDLSRMQAKFLQSFEEWQVALLLEVWRFLIDLATWATRAEFFPAKNNRSLEAYLVWSGPTTILQAFRGELTSIDRRLVPALAASYEPFCEVFNAAMDSKPQSAGILETSRFLSTLTCQRCARRPSDADDLWSKSNWSYLRGVIPPSEFFRALDLPWWGAKADKESLEELCRTVPYPELVHRAFVHRSRKYKFWTPEHWLCTSCLKMFLHHNIEALYRTEEDSERDNPR